MYIPGLWPHELSSVSLSSLVREENTIVSRHVTLLDPFPEVWAISECFARYFRQGRYG